VTEAAPATSGRVRSLVATGWGVALRRGLFASGVLLLVAEAAALAARAVAPERLPLLTSLRVGGLYLATFHRVSMRLAGTDLDVSELTAGRASSGSLEVELAVAPLAVTFVALWLLWRAGRAVAEHVGGDPLERAAHGAKIAPVYAAAVLVVCLVTPIHGAFPFGSLVSGRIELSADPFRGFVLPFLLALAAGALGGWWSAEGSSRIRAVLAGGGSMLALGLALSYAGLLVAGFVRLDGPEALLTPSTGRYFRAVFGPPGVGALVIVHHLAVAPNEAAFVLVPSMGGCVVADRLEEGTERLLCLTRFPRELALPSNVVEPTGSARQVPRNRFDVAPAPYFLFLLVPAVATVLGGRGTALRLGPVSRGRAGLAGALSGVVFAALLVPVAWFSSVSAAGSVRMGDVIDAGGAIRIGPGLVGAFVLGLGWGIVGGGLGAWLRTPRAPGRTPTAGAAPPAR
jgi:hypothetical protein